ncbi:MFS transporter [Ochrobactrum sp. BTU1]|uniref:MFS transporter n=1 Tax=Ochrobactrum sp. BTU1 TaxID=2840456 RepID=UPI001C059C5A|nr:MFS transporter [Ochrobactrum sp. BTU1]
MYRFFVLKDGNLVSAAVSRFVAVALLFDGLAPLFPSMAISGGLTPARFQSIIGCCYAIFACSQLISPLLIAAFGLYRSCAISCLYFGCAATVIACTHNPAVFIVFFSSMFAANSVGSNATRVALHQLTDPNRYKKVIGWVLALVEITQIAIPFLISAFAFAYGWRLALLFLAIPAVTVGCYVVSIDRRHWVRRDVPRARSSKTDWQALFGMPVFLRPVLRVVAYQIGFSVLVARLPFIVEHQANLHQIVGGLILSLDNAFVALCLIVGGCRAPSYSSSILSRIGLSLMVMGVTTIGLSYFLGIYAAIVGIVLFNGAYGFIGVPGSADPLNVPEALRVKASGLLGFLQPMTGGLSVAILSMPELPLIDSALAAALLSTLLLILTMLFDSRGASYQ